MNRPYVFCHMLTSLDGKIMGSYMETPEGEQAGAVFYNIAFGKNPYYKHQGWLSGRVTTDDNFTFYEKPALDENAPAVPEGDYIAKKADMYYVSVDPSGKLGWKDATLHYEDTTAHVIEVLTERAGNAYKAFLRGLGISYIIAGRESLDYALALEKLKTLFGIETLMLGGGGILNWSFIQAGMCDEISVVIAASADGSAQTPALFSAKGGFADERAVRFQLESAEVRDGNDMEAREHVAFANTMSGYSMVVGACTSEHAMEHAMSAYHQELPHGAGLIMISREYYTHFINKHCCDERFVRMAQALGKADAKDPMDFVDALVELQQACGVADLKMSDYGIRKDECMTLAKNARATMGGLFGADPVPMTDEECAAIYERSYR